MEDDTGPHVAARIEQLGPLGGVYIIRGVDGGLDYAEVGDLVYFDDLIATSYEAFVTISLVSDASGVGTAGYGHIGEFNQLRLDNDFFFGTYHLLAPTSLDSPLSVGGPIEERVLSGLIEIVGGFYASTLTGRAPIGPREPSEDLPGDPFFDDAVLRMGTEVGDQIRGSILQDDLRGLAGNDNLRGGAGDDRLLGGAGNDLLHGGEGADILDGGDGIDVLDYRGSSARVSIDLLEGFISGGDAEGDRFFNVERIIASSHNDWLGGNTENNVLHGRSGDDYIYGERGNDTIRGGPGADELDGGAGIDTVDYRDSGRGVYVDLNPRDADVRAGELLSDSSEPVVFGGAAEGDTIVDFENIRGSASTDILLGDAGDNRIWGNGGQDVLSGRNGNDHLRGGRGDDRIFGGSGDDVIYGGHGDDVIDGGQGNDILRGNSGDDMFLFDPAIVVRNVDHEFPGWRGHVRIFDSSGNDTIVFYGLTESDLVFTEIGVEGAQVQISLASRSDTSITFDADAIERIVYEEPLPTF